MRIEEEPIFQPDLLCANNSEASGGIMIDKVVRSNAPMIEIRVETSPELELECPPVNCDPEPVEVLKKCDSTSSLLMNTVSTYGEDLIFPKPIVWDWPFGDSGVAKGEFNERKFMICLPFNAGETSVSTKKFEKISESNFCWSVSLSNNGEFGSSFWRLELEIMPNLNMLALVVCRDISRMDESAKRLKRVRKIYRLPEYYDVRTLTSKSYDWAIILEAYPRGKYRGAKAKTIQRSDSET